MDVVIVHAVDSHAVHDVQNNARKCPNSVISGNSINKYDETSLTDRLGVDFPYIINCPSKESPHFLDFYRMVLVNDSLIEILMEASTSVAPFYSVGQHSQGPISPAGSNSQI